MNLTFFFLLLPLVSLAKGRVACTWHGSEALALQTWTLNSLVRPTSWNKMEWLGRLDLQSRLNPQKIRGPFPMRLSPSAAPAFMDAFLHEVNLYWELKSSAPLEISTPPGGLLLCSDCKKLPCKMYGRWHSKAGSGDKFGFALGQLADEDGATAKASPSSTNKPPSTTTKQSEPTASQKFTLPEAYEDPDRKRALENKSSNSTPLLEPVPAVLDGTLPR